MALPYPPSALRATLIRDGDSEGIVILKWLRFQVMDYVNYVYKWGSDGNLTAEFKADLCNDFRAAGGCNPVVGTRCNPTPEPEPLCRTPS